MAEERAVEPAAEEPASIVADLRRRIDELDELLVRLLSARAACALEVGRQKKLMGIDIYQPGREAEVLGHVQRINPGPLDNESMKRLFERVIDEARRLERHAEPEAPAGAEAPARQTPECSAGASAPAAVAAIDSPDLRPPPHRRTNS